MIKNDLTIIIVNYNTKFLIPECLDAVASATSDLSVQIIIVDNASTDDSVCFIRENYPEVEIVLSEENVGFGRANNKALDLVKSDYILLLNTDAFLSPDSLLVSLDYIKKNAECGVLGVQLVGRDGTLQPSCRFFPSMMNIFLSAVGGERFFPNVKMIDYKGFAPECATRCDWVPGCFYLTRKAVVDEVGLFDPRFFMYYEEVDHCLRVKRAGYEVHYIPDTSVVHIGGESAKGEGELTGEGKQLNSLNIESELLFFRKNKGLGYTLAHLLLSSMTILILIVKVLCKHSNKKAKARFLLRDLSQLWHIAKMTKFGLMPTR